MNWFERDTMHLSGKYRIYRDTRGCSAWYYGGKVQCVLARELTLEQAKQICEEHRATKVNDLSELTARQLQVYQAIDEAIKRNGMPPTCAELARTLNLASPNAIHEHLKALHRKGVLELIPKISRGIRLLVDL